MRIEERPRWAVHRGRQDRFLTPEIVLGDAAMVPGCVEFYSGRSVMFSHDGGSYGARAQMEGYHERASWARGLIGPAPFICSMTCGLADSKIVVGARDGWIRAADPCEFGTSFLYFGGHDGSDSVPTTPRSDPLQSAGRSSDQ